MSNRSIQVGLIGTGGMGGRHLHNLAETVTGATVSAIMDVDENRLANLQSQYNIAQTFTDAHALINDPNVQAVVIASPDSTHAKLTLACLEADKPVLCEKPLASNAEDAQRIFQTEVAKNKRLIQIGFMREYDPAHQKVKAVLQTQQIGTPLLFRGFHYNLTQEVHRHINDVITNSAIHDIHSAHWLMGQEITQVYVQHIPNTPSAPETCRLLVIQLQFHDGSLGVIQVNSEAAYGYEVIVDITGEKGQITTPTLPSPIVRVAGQSSQAVEPDWLERFDTAYQNEIQSWITSVAKGQLQGPTAWDGYTSLVVADACKRSYETGQPQAVPLVDRPSFYPSR